VTAIPLIVRGKVVAALYADSSSSDPNAMNVDALELLARVASMAVNLVSVQRSVAPAAADTSSVAPATTYVPQVEAPSDTQGYDAAKDTAELASGFVPVEPAAEFDTEPPQLGAITQPLAEEAVGQADATVEEGAGVSLGSIAPAFNEPQPSVAATLKPDVVSAQIWGSESPAEAAPESADAPVSEPEPEPAPAPEPILSQPAEPSQSPAYSSQYSAPLGTSRRSSSSRVSG